MLIEVLVDKKEGNLSLVSTDDSDGQSVETTLSIEEAGNLVSEIMLALQKLRTAAEIQSAPIKYATTYKIDGRGSSTATKEQVRAAVREAVGATDSNKPRYSKPGSPSTIQSKGLRNLYQDEQVDSGT
jgi:collagenase-like PrtC family protease